MSQAIGYEGGVPLTGRIARDRWVKKLRDEDLDRRDANLGRAGAAGAIAGALFPSRKMGIYKRMGIGAVAGTAGVLGVRQATKNSRDAYGERSRGAKRAESLPAVAALTGAGLLTAKKLGLLKKLKFAVGSRQSSVELEKPFHGYSEKRHAKTGGLNDSFRRKYNRENGSNLKRPVTTEPSKLKPGSKSAKRRASFCARMGGMQGPTSKDGKLTPKGAALKRWNCSAEVSSVQFSEKKEKKGLNPYVGATASGAISGAALGFIPTILRRGNSLKTALKAGALGGLASGAIVGGGALIGSRILGEPREDEGSAFTKRAAIGGTIAGAGAGLAGGLLLRKTAKGQKILADAAKNWRPAEWLHKGPVAGSAAIGAVAGAGYGGATGADEGQQVDSLRHLRKDLRKDVKAAAMKLEGKVGSVQFSVGSKAKFFITRIAGRAEEGTVVGKASSLKSARRVKNKHDLKYGATAHKIVDQEGKPVLFAQKDWRDARRESRSEAAKDVMVGGGALAAGAGVGGGALWAARKFGQNADKAGAAAEQVTETLKGVTKPRFVRSRQWLKKQMSFPTFGKMMKKFRMSSTAAAVELSILRPKGRTAGWSDYGKIKTSEGRAKFAKALNAGRAAGWDNYASTPAMKDLLKGENARGAMRQKFRNFLRVLPLESKQRLTEFYMLRKDLTEEQRNVRNAVVAGTVGVGAAAGVAAVGLRSLKRADEAMRQRWSSIPAAPATLPEMSTPKKNLTPTMQDKWAAAQARAAMSPKGSGRTIRVEAPQAMARQAEARRIKEIRAVSRAPIADAAEGARASTKARVAQGRKLQKIASVGNAGVLSRGERMTASAALAALRKKFRFEHNFAVRYRDKDGKSTGWKSWAKGETVYDENMNPTKMGVGSLANSMNRYAQQGWRESRRGANLVRDFREVASGQKTKKREWEKSYFKDRVAGALGTAGLIAGTVLYRKGGKYGAPKWAQKWHGAVNKVGSGIQSANRTAQGWLDRQVNGFEARFNATVRMFSQDNWRRAGYTGMLTGGPLNVRDEIDAERYYRAGGVEYRKRDALKHALPGAAAAIPATIAGYKYAKSLARRGKPLSALAVRVGFPAAAVGVVNSFVGPSKQAVSDRAKRTREFSTAEYKQLAKNNYKDTARKRDYITSNIGSVAQSGLAGTLPGMAIGGLLAGKRGVKPGLFAGIAGGIATRAILQKRINRKEDKWIEEANSGQASNLRQWANDTKHTAINVGIPLGLAGAGIGIAVARKPLFRGAKTAARSARKMAATARAKMPVSKATQDARFAKAKPARAWEVGGSQAAPSNWPRLAMESRMNATLQMFEGYGPYQDYYSAPGWDLRDARGKSARVFAPGAKKRMRRPAEWHEKKDNQKKLIAGAGVAAALLAGGGGFYWGTQRALRLGKLAKTNAKFRASKGGFGDISGLN